MAEARRNRAAPRPTKIFGKIFAAAMTSASHGPGLRTGVGAWR